MELMNANDRPHWSKRAKTSALIRAAARELSKGIPSLGKVKIRAVYYAPDNRRRDVSNLFPSVKSAIDGVVDAGVLKDDNDKFVVSLEMVRGEYNIRGGQLVIEIIDLADEVI
jgi:crossover junction endodeoxyribonuclease RusA